MSHMYKDFYMVPVTSDDGWVSEKYWTFTHKRDSYTEPGWYYESKDDCKKAINKAMKTGIYPDRKVYPKKTCDN